VVIPSQGNNNKKQTTQTKNKTMHAKWHLIEDCAVVISDQNKRFAGLTGKKKTKLFSVSTTAVI